MTSVDRRFEKMFRQEDRSREVDDLGKYAANESYLRPSRHRHRRTKHEESKMASHRVRRITCGDQRRKTVSSILPWVESRSRQLVVATRRKLSRPRFLAHEIRAGARKGKKNQSTSLRHDLGSLLVPADIRRLEKNWSIDGRRPSAEKKKLNGHRAPFRLFVRPSKGIFGTIPALRKILSPVPRRPLVRCRRNNSMAFFFEIFVARWTAIIGIFINETVNR